MCGDGGGGGGGGGGGVGGGRWVAAECFDTPASLP